MVITLEGEVLFPAANRTCCRWRGSGWTELLKCSGSST